MEVGKGGRGKEDTCNYVKKKIMRLCRTAKEMCVLRECRAENSHVAVSFK